MKNESQKKKPGNFFLIELNKLYSDFLEQEKKTAIGSLIPHIKDIFNNNRNTDSVMDYRKSSTDDFLSLVYVMPSLSKKFWEREVVSNMSTLITVPFIFRENNTFFMASGYRKKSNAQLKVSLTHVFGYYNHQTKQFLWNPKELYPLDVMTHYHNNLFQKLDILNHLLIKNYYF